ncbi:MAG: hypothetical protein EPN82_14750 [Bacteroidetes bacterium]|nr:MAG: hypothetical protein EPN82_14750 [Bacteroidota bacterium]
MKKTLRYVLFSFALISLFAISSCNEKGNNIPTNSSVNYEYSQMVFPSFDKITGENVTGGTIIEGFSIIQNHSSKTTESKQSKIQCGDGDGHHDDGDDEEHEGEDDEDDDGGCHYGTILSQLNLTDAQRTQIHQFKEEFEDCVEFAEENYESAKHTLLADANQQRQDILQQLENGSISDTQAQEQLQNLKASVLQQIADLQQQFQAEAGNCQCSFLTNIISVLDDIQKAAFISWIESNNCNNINCDLGGTFGNQQ